MIKKNDPIQNAYKEMLLEAFIVKSLDTLTEGRIDFLKNTYKDKPFSTEHDPRAIHTDTDAIIDHIASVDPTPKNVYTGWMVNHYRKGGFKQEDAYRVGDDLKTFHDNKARMSHQDIAKYNPATLSDDASRIRIMEPAPLSKKAASREVEAKGRKLVYEAPEMKIYQLENSPEGKKASQDIYGGGWEIGGNHTKWCTADRRDKYNRFDETINDGPLNVIHFKPHGADKEKVYQYHVNSNQFMDAKDERVVGSDWEALKPHLHTAWDKHPELLK